MNLNKIKYLAIIPARKGSKRIVNKNIQLIAGKPMIQYTIEAAMATKKIDKLFISSDDKKIFYIARKFHVDIPFVRPKRIATAKIPMMDVIVDAITRFKKLYKYFPENIILLQPTSPFRSSADIDKAIKIFEHSGKNSLISVSKVTQHPFDFVLLSKKGKLIFLEEKVDHIINNKNNRKDVYFIDGSIYISRTKNLMQTKKLFDSSSELFLINKSHALDINYTFDLENARALKYYAEFCNNSIFDL